MNMVHLKINGIDAEVPAGSTILEAAKSVQIEIPSLCYLKDINCIGACRVCVVEVKGHKGLVASCVYPVEEGMEVFTNTPKVRTSRKTTIELILSSHRKRCLSCVRGNHCELQKLAFDYEVDEGRRPGLSRRRQIRLYRAGQFQVHPMYALRGGVQKAAGGLCHRGHPAGLPGPRGLCL